MPLATLRERVEPITRRIVAYDEGVMLSTTPALDGLGLIADTADLAELLRVPADELDDSARALDEVRGSVQWYRTPNGGLLDDLRLTIEAWCDEHRRLDDPVFSVVHGRADDFRDVIAGGLHIDESDWLCELLRHAEVMVTFDGWGLRRWRCPDNRWRKLPEAAAQWRAYVLGEGDDDDAG